MTNLSKIKNLIYSYSKSQIYANLICILTFSLVVFGSIWQGFYNIDPHHWGLMLSNAKDLYEGKMPYQQIYIQYGFLTTFIHSIAYGWAGGNLISIITITAIAYATGLIFIYRITLTLTGNIKIALYVLITCFLIHPIAIYPWSNYIAFPFFIYGMLMLVQNPQTYRGLFLSGISFGLAILSREGLAPAIVLILLFSLVLDFFQPDRNKKNYSTSALLLISGLLIPIAIFSLYLSYYGLLPYWYKLSWLLPKIYLTEIFPHASGFSGPIGLFTHIVKRAISLDFRWFLLGTVICANLIVLALIFARQKHSYLTLEATKIAIATLLLLSSTLHIPEIFRLATGSMIGVITFYILLAHFKHANCAFAYVLFTLGLSLTVSNSGNYFWPTSDTVKSAQLVKTPSFFKGQRWDNNAIQYYQEIDLDLKNLKKSSCSIDYHYNYTMDAFLQVLSPYMQYQIAPFGVGAKINNLRPDLDLNKKIGDAKDIILFQMVPEKELSTYKPQDGFYIYKRYFVPNEYFIEAGNRLLILIPRTCESKVANFNTTLTKEIDFTRPSYPSFIKDIRGLSIPEPWGRWSDANLAPSVHIDFYDPLPKRFNLVFTAESFGPNSDQYLLVRIGSQIHQFKMQEAKGEYRKSIDLGSAKISYIEFLPPQPTSPKQLNINEDNRKLGIGLIRLRIGD